MNKMDFRQDQIRFYETAAEKGWHDEGLDKSYQECLMLMVSEISEALEEYRAGHGFNEIYYNGDSKKPEGIPVELADFYIRFCDMAEQIGYDVQNAYDASDCFEVLKSDGTFTEHLFHLTAWTTQCGWSEKSLASVYFNLLTLCERFDIDLPTAVEIKHEYNKTRPYRHGNKKV